MVLAGEHYILAARIPGELGPFFRQAFPGLEQGQSFRGVGVRIHFHVFLNPFGTSGPAFPFPGQSGIQAVMDEHAEFGVPPPFHAPVAFLRRFRDSGMVGIRGEGEAGRRCRKFRGNGGRGGLLRSAVAQPGCELFVQGQRGLPVFRNDFSGGLLGRGGKPQSDGQGGNRGYVHSCSGWCEAGGRLNRLK